MWHKGVTCTLHHAMCLCNNCPTESALHFFLLCPFAMQVFEPAAEKFQFANFLVPIASVQLVSTKSRDRIKSLEPAKFRTWTMISTFSCTCLMLWMLRNGRIFAVAGELMPPNQERGSESCTWSLLVAQILLALLRVGVRGMLAQIYMEWMD